MIGSERGGARFEDVNVAGTRAVVQAAAAAGVPRVVLFSGLGVARYGLAPRSTNRYFASKALAEAEAWRSALEVVALRPSYVVGPGDGFITLLLRELAGGAVHRPGDGTYRMQPAAVRDAADAALAAASEPIRTGRSPHRVVDLVGPTPIAFRDFVPLVAEAARAAGRPHAFRWEEVPVAEADRAAAAAGAWRGYPPEDLDGLLCDEVADAAPLEGLLGRALTPLAEAVATAVAGTRT
jgi:NADH dehydrogenase